MPRITYHLGLDEAEAFQLLTLLQMLRDCGMLMASEEGPLKRLEAIFTQAELG